MGPFVEFIENANLLSLFIKLFGVVMGLLYLFFSVIMIKQVKVMQRIVTIDDGGALKILANLQVVLAVVIVLFALFIL